MRIPLLVLSQIIQFLCQVIIEEENDKTDDETTGPDVTGAAGYKGVYVFRSQTGGVLSQSLLDLFQL